MERDARDAKRQAVLMAAAAVSPSRPRSPSSRSPSHSPSHSRAENTNSRCSTSFPLRLEVRFLLGEDEDDAVRREQARGGRVAPPLLRMRLTGDTKVEDVRQRISFEQGLQMQDFILVTTPGV